MKDIFDNIRAHFAHKPKEFRNSSSLLRALSCYERSLRGFSHRLEVLTGLRPLQGDDVLLQKNLRSATKQLLQSLSQENLTQITPEEDAILRCADSTGYLKSTAVVIMWGTHPRGAWSRDIASQIGNVGFDTLLTAAT